MKFLLVDRDPLMTQAWAKEFVGIENVEVHCGDFFDQPTDCVVSPANSFGFMDGGLDLAISKRFGWQLQERVQKRIKEEYDGELLVGDVFSIDTYDSQIPYCIIAPTMRVPQYVPDTVNAYLAARGIFLLAKRNWDVVKGTNGALGNTNIRRITMSGMCTGVGAMPYQRCARQMKVAYDDFWLGQYQAPRTWMDAQHKNLILSGWEYNPI
jgi:O-acetyl-ADP-ribose deacetylase (regulator of RNase III)